MDIAIATCPAHPELHAYDSGIIDALRELGLEARAVVWSDPAATWRQARAVLAQSAWDSHLRTAEFLAWTREVQGVTRLYNPARIIEWNIHKSYLRELERRGVAVTPTAWVAQGGSIDLHELMRARQWERAVLKPAISAGANETHVIHQRDATARQADVERLARSQELMIQPYLTAFETEGERSYVFFDGEFSHAVHRPPTLDSAVRGYSEPHAFEPAAGAEMELAEAVIAAIGEPLLYARVDLATNEDGVARLQEVELIEPCLFTALAPGAAARFARALAERLSTGT